MVTGWRKIGSTWYYLNPGNGDMAQGWKKIGNVWYYLDNSGAMATGWQKINGKYRYFSKKNGKMQKSKRIGKYYVNSKGIRTKKK